MDGGGSVSVVVGGARGLGLAAARALAARGDRVHVTWRTSDDAAVALSEELDGRVHRVDALRSDELERLVADVVARDGRLDHLVHAVGDVHFAPLAETGPATLRRMLESNVETAFRALDAARAALRASAGSAVLFGCAGLSAGRARRSVAAYVAAKSALLSLARSAALEEAPFGVRVNVVSPGRVPHEHAAAETRDPASWESIPMGRPGRPEEVAEAVAWLTSAAAGYVTGAHLEIAGGWLA